MLALPIFPASHPASIFGEHELNFCVRDGNRWTLIAINTNYDVGESFPPTHCILAQANSLVKNFFSLQIDKCKALENPERWRIRDFWRYRPDLNWGMRVLQTLALPLGYGTI